MSEDFSLLKTRKMVERKNELNKLDKNEIIEILIAKENTLEFYVDLYKELQEKNKEKSKKIKELNTLLGEFIDNSFSKDKIREIVNQFKPNKTYTFIENQERYITLIERIEDLLKEN